MVSGDRHHAEALCGELAEVLSKVGLRLSEEKTKIVHIGEGFEFLGFRIRRQRKQGSNKSYVYTWPSKKALASVMAKIRQISKQGTSQSLADLLRQINPVLRGWTNYFQYGVSKATFGYLQHFTWMRVVKWMRRKHHRSSWNSFRSRHMGNKWLIADDGVILFDPREVSVTRYRYRGSKIPSL